MYLSLRDNAGPAERTDGPDGPDGTGTDAAPKRSRVSRTVLTLGMVSLLTDISSESVSAILPLYLTAVVGLSPVAYGLIDGLYQGASTLVRIAAGWAADRTGRPWWVALLGSGLSMLARGVLLFTTGLGAITALLAVDRIGKGVRTAPRDAMISASSDPEHLGRSFGVHRTLDTIGAAIGPVLAFVILWLIPDGYGTVLLVSFCFALLGVALLGLFVSPRTGTTPAADQPPAETGLRWREIATPSMRRLLLVAGGLGLLTVGDGFVYLTVLDSGDFAARWFPLLYVGTNVAYLALALPLGKLADRWGRARMLVVGHVALAAAYVAAASAIGGATATLATMLFLGTFYAATDGVLAALAGTLVPAPLRASGIASAQTAVALARLVSAAGFGLLWVLVGPGVAMVGIAAVLLLVLPAAFAVLARLDRPEPVAC